MRLRRYLIISFTTLLIIGPCCLAFAIKHDHKPSTIVLAQATATPVEVTKVKKTNIPNQVHALGSLNADQDVTISPEVNGRISQIFFKDGQEVAAGMPIIQLDNTKDRAAYDSAQAALNVARNKYNRAQKLWNEGAVSKQDLEQLKADVESRAADVKTALATLNQKQLTAPFAGTLGAFQAQPGDYVKQGATLVTLVNTKQIKVKYSLPENIRPQLKLSQEVMIHSAAYPHKTFYGTVTFIAPSIDVATRSIALQAEIDNSDGLLAPGMFVQVTQNINIDQNALVIPDQAIVADLQGYSVFVIKDNRAHQQTITLGARVAGLAQVTSGLNQGDLVVTAGQQKLSDNDLVKIIAVNNNVSAQ